MEAVAPGLATRLQALVDRDLAILLARRPEATALAGRAQPQWTELAAVLAHPRNVAIALARLDRFHSQALQLACLAGGRLTAAAAAAEGLAPVELRSAAAELGRWGLAFPDADGALAVPREVARVVWDPGGLGSPAVRLLENLTVEELRQVALGLGSSGPALPKRKADLVDVLARRIAEPGVIAAVLHRAPAAARAELERLRRAGGSSAGARLGGLWDHPYSWGSIAWQRDLRDGPIWLLAHGIVLPEDLSRMSVAVPSEVERALRGRVFARWDSGAPPLDTGALREETHALELVAAMDGLLESWRHTPPPALKDGGVPRREIARAAQTIGRGEAAVAQLVELGFAAGLLRERELVPEKRSRSYRHPRVLQSRRAVIEVTDDLDGWREAPEAERWFELALIWMRLLSDAAEGAPSRERERLLLDALGGIEPGRGATAASLGALLAWRHPAYFEDEATGTALARSLGVAIASLGAGGAEPAIGLNDAGRLVFLSGGAVDAAALQRAFPPLVERCVVTADHRVVVSGPPSSALARFLVSVADVVSVRPARVYRITEASLARALDGGHTAERILAELRAHASADVPANVAALVEDVGRRHGRVRVGTAGVYVIADDPAHLEALARSRAFKGSALRRIAPTVGVVEGSDRDAVMTALRRAGLMPVADGSATPEGPKPRRARRPGVARARPAAPPPAEPASIDAAALAQLADALRSAPSPRESVGPAAPAEDAVRAALVAAARVRQRVEIGYQQGFGALSVHVVSPFEVRGDHVLAQDPVRFGYHTFEVRRVMWVDAADAAPQPEPRLALLPAPGARPFVGPGDDVADDDDLDDDDLDDDDRYTDDDDLDDIDIALTDVYGVVEEDDRRGRRRRR